MAKLSSLVSFCVDLKSRLPTSRDLPALEALREDLATHLRTAEAPPQKTQPGGKRYAADLDAGGTELWNLCTKLRRELGDGTDDEAGPRRKLLSRCRYFAFLLISIARRDSLGEGREGTRNVVSLVKIALKAARSCVEEGELGVSLDALQKAGDYIELLKGRKGCDVDREGGGDGEVEDEVKRLEVDYFILRTVQAWKEDRLDVSEHMFRKAGDMLATLDSRAAENLADTFFDIGWDFLPKKEFQMAAKWLERAYEIIDGQDIEKLSRDGVELRLMILQAFIQALVGTKTQENLKKAEDCVAYVEAELGDKPVLLLLRLELLQNVPEEEFDPLAYENVLNRMVKSFNYTEEHFKFMLHHARWLYNRSAALGCSVMDGLMTTRILPSEKKQYFGELQPPQQQLNL
ncbi:uncharacterized protein DNG_06002 [Cephalotrichum gorgonifer]|uniref:Uncharacterized protein n=1 Tax=Cephalotrichum gorgonifer TaxID=2041049 RepID=A0AAE8MZ65_9PEZI|nr:uncharacterized protein DNG_06002 [Cephalotrichum gorgonifer]